MENLKTSYMGIELKNPLIVGASHMTADMDTIKKLEEAGAAALVTKSLFEEQVQLDRFRFDEVREKFNYRHPMMVDVGAQQDHAGPKAHLYWVEKAQKTCQIPVIASVNAVNRETWIDYAKRLESTGIDALELNFYASPAEINKPATEIEKEQLDIVMQILNEVSVPVSLKLSPYYTNPLHFIKTADVAGVHGFVLFNRLFQPEINIQNQKPVFPFYLSHAEDHRLPLRYAGLLYDEIQADICSSTGIYHGDDAVKMILTGASCFQVVSALIKNKVTHIHEMLTEIKTWMKKNQYTSISDFQGNMSRKKMKDPWVYTRAQYIRWIMNPDALMRDYEIP